MDDAPHQYGLALHAPATDDTLKEKARLAFLAHEAHVLAGETDLAEAARKRFLDASAALTRAKGVA